MVFERGNKTTGKRFNRRPNTNQNPLWQRLQQNETASFNKFGSTTIGLSSLNGKLVNSNDVGLKLRQLHNNLKEKKLAKQNPVVVNLNISNEKQPRYRKKPFQAKKQKVFFTKPAKSCKLVMSNLVVGTDGASLKELIEDNSGLKIKTFDLRDLPSGSSVCEIVFDGNVTAEQIQTVRNDFDGSQIDYRKISCKIVQI